MSYEDEERRARMRDKHTGDVNLRDWWNLTKRLTRIFHHRRKPYTAPAVRSAWERVGYADDGREIERNRLLGTYRIKPVEEDEQ
jgi:hypothetical protein